MPEVRHNPLTGDRVIVAPQRAVRPHAARPQSTREELPPFDPSCPFCPGNEDMTPPELSRYPATPAVGPGWRVRVVPNKYPAFGPLAGEAAPGSPEECGPLEHADPAVGRHEVIIETPAHDRDLTGLSADEMLEVMRTYRARYAAAAADEQVRHILIFRNYGRMANASLEHPHSQFVGLPFVPPKVGGKLERSRRYRESRGRVLALDMVETEVRRERRLIETSDALATFVPYAPNHDFEVWIAPRAAAVPFERSDDATLAQLGRALQRALSAQDAALGNPDYNFLLHTPPLAADAPGQLPWYVQIVPRVTVTAGFELGLGVHILITTPEEAATRLRAGLSKVAGV